jgi:hypothetical protein
MMSVPNLATGLNPFRVNPVRLDFGVLACQNGDGVVAANVVDEEHNSISISMPSNSKQRFMVEQKIYRYL